MSPNVDHGQPALDSPASTPTGSLAMRTRRQQVSKACDGCRLRRTKCDDSRPCRACLLRGEQCSARGNHDLPRSLPQALKEIDRLRRRVQELETHEKTFQCSNANKNLAGDRPGQIFTVDVDTDDHPVYSPPVPVPPTSSWEGIFVAIARSDQKSYYGPSSTSYFISRIGSFLARTLHDTVSDRSLQSYGVNRELTNPTDADGNEPLPETSDTSHISAPSNMQTASMSRTLEEYFLGIYWEWYHVSMPILDERGFRNLYRSLWDTSRGSSQTIKANDTGRKHSALVDIVLALSIQHGYTFIPRDRSSRSKEQYPHQDATIAGRWYYQRCQSLVARELESPSLSTLQCLAFSAVYLCCASFQNMAYSVVAQAIRIAQLLGVHLEPPASMPLADRELRKRIWWVICTIETKTCIKLGRPFALQSIPAWTSADATLTPAFPRDDAEVAVLHGTERGVFAGGVTWLSYARQCHRMLLVTTGIHTAVWPQYDLILAAHGQSASPYRSPQALEACATYLASRISPFLAWATQVPEGLWTPRRGGTGRAYSFDRTLLDFDAQPLVPPWLRRQRIWLEILYHTMAINLYRPFVSFYPCISDAYTPTANAHAVAAARHAIALVSVMHQAVLETDLMRGWHEFFLFHWNASVTLVGFLLANPVHVTAGAVRAALDQSIAVCDAYSEDFMAAANAAAIVRDLTARADILTGRIRGEVLTGGRPMAAESASSTVWTDMPSSGMDSAGETSAESGVGTGTADSLESLAWLDPSRAESEVENYSEFMDWALTVDTFNSFEHFYETSGDFMIGR